MIDIYGLTVLFFALLIIASLLSAAMFAAMFLIHKYARNHVTATHYADFHFDTIQKPALQNLLRKIALIIFPPTLALPILEFLIVGIYIRAQPALASFILLILQTAAVAFAIHKVLKIDQRRILLLTAVTSLLYLFFYWLIIFTLLRS